MNPFFCNKGQSIIEYAVIIGIVVLALSAMQVYVKRGIQAVIKGAADEVGPQGYAVDFGLDTENISTSEATIITDNSERRRLFTGGRQRRDFGKTSTSTGLETTIETKTRQVTTGRE